MKDQDPKLEEFFYYEQQVNRELKRKHISGYRYNERLTSKNDGSKLLGYTGFRKLGLISVILVHYKR